MARSQVLSIREEEYVQSLKVFGLNPFIICYKHILPNALSPDYCQCYTEYGHVYPGGGFLKLLRPGRSAGGPDLGAIF